MIELALKIARAPALDPTGESPPTSSSHILGSLENNNLGLIVGATRPNFAFVRETRRIFAQSTRT